MLKSISWQSGKYVSYSSQTFVLQETSPSIQWDWEQLSFPPNQSRLKHLTLLLILWEEPSYARVLQ